MKNVNCLSVVGKTGYLAASHTADEGKGEIQSQDGEVHVHYCPHLGTTE